MGDENQLAYVLGHAARLGPPYLEVGSRDHGSTQDLRAQFRARGEYVGVDAEPGPGVDRVVDFTADFAVVDAALGGRRFGSIFCLSVLEHCAQPFQLAANATRLVVPGGAVCIGAPFAWRFHSYPSDYWRFTHEGIKQLFPDLDFDMAEARVASERLGDVSPVDLDLGRIPFSLSAHRRRGHPLRGVVAAGMQQLARVGLLRWLAGHRYVLAPSNVLMIGTKPEA